MSPACHPLVTIKPTHVTCVKEVPSVLQRHAGVWAPARHKIDMTLVAHQRETITRWL